MALSETSSVAVEGIGFSCGPGGRRLAGVSLDVRPGELCALLGPNGALDEPAAALDHGNEVRFLDVTARLTGQGQSVLMTTHQPSHARTAVTRPMPTPPQKISPPRRHNSPETGAPPRPTKWDMTDEIG